MDYPPSTASSIASPVSQHHPQHLAHHQFRYTPPSLALQIPNNIPNSRSRSSSVSVSLSHPVPLPTDHPASSAPSKPRPPTLTINVSDHTQQGLALHSQSAPGSAISNNISPHPLSLSLDDGPQHPDRTVPRKRPSMGDPPQLYSYTTQPTHSHQPTYLDSEMSYSPMDEKPPSANPYDPGPSLSQPHLHTNTSGTPSNTIGNAPNNKATTTTTPTGPTPGMSTNFVGKLYQMINDPRSKRFIVWTDHGTSFVVSNISEFSRTILGVHFKHNNFSSFVRQLNMYGFSKVNRTPRAQKQHPESQVWEFAHPKFIRSRPEFLEEIRRRPTESNTPHHSSVHAHPHGGPPSASSATAGNGEFGGFGFSTLGSNGSTVGGVSVGGLGSTGPNGFIGSIDPDITKELNELREEIRRLLDKNKKLESLLEGEKGRVTTLGGLVKTLWDAATASGVDLPTQFPSDILGQESSLLTVPTTPLDDNPPIYVTSPMTPLETTSSPIHSVTVFGTSANGGGNPTSSSPPHGRGGLLNLNLSPGSSPTGAEFSLSMSTSATGSGPTSTDTSGSGVGVNGVHHSFVAGRPPILERGLSLPQLNIPIHSTMGLSTSTSGTGTAPATGNAYDFDHSNGMSAGPPSTADSYDWSRYGAGGDDEEDGSRNHGQPEFKRARGLSGGPIVPTSTSTSASASTAPSESGVVGAQGGGEPGQQQQGQGQGTGSGPNSATQGQGQGSQTTPNSSSTGHNQTQWPTHPLPRRARSGSAPLHHLTSSVGGLTVGQSHGQQAQHQQHQWGIGGRPRSGSSALLYPGAVNVHGFAMSHGHGQHLHPHAHLLPLQHQHQDLSGGSQHLQPPDFTHGGLMSMNLNTLNLNLNGMNGMDTSMNPPPPPPSSSLDPTDNGGSVTKTGGTPNCPGTPQMGVLVKEESRPCTRAGNGL